MSIRNPGTPIPFLQQQDELYKSDAFVQDFKPKQSAIKMLGQILISYGGDREHEVDSSGEWSPLDSSPFLEPVDGVLIQFQSHKILLIKYFSA